MWKNFQRLFFLHCGGLPLVNHPISNEVTHEKAERDTQNATRAKL